MLMRGRVEVGKGVEGGICIEGTGRTVLGDVARH